MAEPAGPAQDPRSARAPPASPGRASAWAVALCLLVPLLFFLPALSPGRQFGYFDNGRMHVPMKRYIASEYASGRFPAWNPYSGLGMPLAAGGVDAVQHPFNLLLVGLPFDLGFKLWVLLCFPLAALGARALARRLGLGEAAATTAGLAFALSGYPVSMTGNMVYLGALACFPWILATGLDFVERPGPGRAALVAAASGLCAASGDPQGWAIAVGLLPVAAAVFPAPGLSRPRAAWRAAGAAAAALAGALPFVAPVAAWIPHSSRGEPFDAYEYAMFNLLPLRALELLIPGLFFADGTRFAYPLFDAYAGDLHTPLPWALSEYVGAGVVALALLGAWHHRAARWLLAGAAAFTWMAMGSHAGFGQLARHLPVLSSFRFWEKLATWPALFLAVAAGFGLQSVLAPGWSSRRSAAAVALAGAAMLSLGGLARLAPGPVARLLPPAGPPAEAALELAGHLSHGLIHAGLVLLLLGAALALLAGGRLRSPALSLGALLLAELALANARAYRLSDVETHRPPAPLAAWLRERDASPRLLTPFPLSPDGNRYRLEMEPSSRLGAEGLYAAWNVGERVGNFQAWSGMLPVRTNRYWRRMGHPDHLPGVGLWGYRWLWVPPDAGAEVARRLPPGRPWSVPGVPGTVRELPSRPRAYLAGELATVDRRAAMEFALDPGQVTRGRSVLEAPLPAGYLPPGGEARITSDEPSRVELAARADGTALLVLNDVYAAGWSAEVDGAAAEILPVNYLARGVWIPAGSHRVTFSYRTPWLAGSWAALGLAALAAAAWALRRRRAAMGNA